MLIVQNNSVLQRYEIFEAGGCIGFVQYEMHHEEMWVLFTQLRRKFKNVARVSKALGHVLEDARRSRIRVVPFCPAFRVFVCQTPSYISLVPEEWHERVSSATRDERGDAGKSVLQYVRFTGSPWRRPTAAHAVLLAS